MKKKTKTIKISKKTHFSLKNASALTGINIEIIADVLLKNYLPGFVEDYKISSQRKK